MIPSWLMTHLVPRVVEAAPRPEDHMEPAWWWEWADKSLPMKITNVKHWNWWRSLSGITWDASKYTQATCPTKTILFATTPNGTPNKGKLLLNVLVPLFQAVALAFVSNVRRIMRRNNKYSPCDLNVGITCNDVMVIAGCGCTCNFLLYSTLSANWW